MELEKKQVLHGLPEKVIYCKRCCISNQRPSTKREFSKKSTKDTDTVGFGDDGICDTCKWFDHKKTINWEEREEQLKKLCDRFRRNDGSYDVILPSSGGKDSFYVAHQLKYKYGMNPLTVTWAPHMYTEIGWQNFQSMIDAGFDNVLVTPNGKVHRILTRLAFENLVNPFQPFIIGQKNAGPRVALQYGVQFIMYGENQAEAHNNFNDNLKPGMDTSHFTRESNSEELYFGGVNIEGLKKYGVEEKDLYLYKPLLRKEIENAGIEVYFYSYFKNWSPQENYYYAMEHSKFKPNPDGRSEGTYTKFASLDDRIDGQHYYTMYIKFGQGRAMNDVNRDIRDGFITREEGIELINKYDGEFPKMYFKEVLDYLDITEEKYWEIIDNARSPHLWEKTEKGWMLKHKIK